MKMMMKKLAFLITVLAVIGITFAAVPYTASVAVTPTIIGRGETFAIYGYIEHATGTVYPLSSMKLKVYKSGTSGSPTEITSIEYMADAENPDNLILNGAFLVRSISTSGFSDGTYTVQLLINNEVVSTGTFAYNSALVRNSTLTISSVYPVAGSLNVEYSISKTNTLNDAVYDVKFYAPTKADMNALALQESLYVGSSNTSARIPYASMTYPFTRGANIFVITAASNNSDSTKSYVEFMRSGDVETSDSSATLTLGTCSAKEGVSKQCTFTVTNRGINPAGFTINAQSALTTQVSFTTGLVQPGQSATGTLTLTAAIGAAPSKPVTLNLYHGSTLLDTVTESVAVETRDLIDSVSISSFTITPEEIHPGDEITVTVKLSNTGDFVERVKLQYALGEDEVTLGTTYTLNVRQNKTVTLNLIAPEETTSLSVNVLKEDSVLAGRIANINVEPYTFTPYADWTTSYKYAEQGNSTTNILKIKNNGNIGEYYQVSIISEFASLDQRVYLTPGQAVSITVPVVVSQTAEIGAKSINATICSLTSNECATDVFTLTILEMARDRSTVVLNDSVQELTSDQGAVFTVQVENFEGETHTYKLSMGTFDGTLQINPTQLTLLNGESGVFYVFAQPAQKETQNLAYTVLRENDAVNRGNLTIKMGATGLTGFITLANAGDVGLIVFGALIIAGLVFIGIRSYNQSKVELKYWR
ncbi:Uncharacterised protein [Candidatus Tiddalikarchaeum anstoanum]|nr:Uncharacterised protein [Candidatus Tiddalikarchaeum anstoanum]